jgi:hypothetical protein
MQPQTAMRVRGTVKVVLVVITANNILSFVFSRLAELIAAAPSPSILMVFGFATSLLVSFWIQADARRAYAQAKNGGFLKRSADATPPVVLKPECPRRWLVALHLELNPALAGM